MSFIWGQSQGTDRGKIKVVSHVSLEIKKKCFSIENKWNTCSGDKPLPHPPPRPLHCYKRKSSSKVCPACEILRSLSQGARRRDFPGDPVAKTLHSQCRGLAFPVRGTRFHVLQLRSWHKQIGKKKRSKEGNPSHEFGDFTGLTVACQISWNLLWLASKRLIFLWLCGHEEKSWCVPSIYLNRTQERLWFRNSSWMRCGSVIEAHPSWVQEDMSLNIFYNVKSSNMNEWWWLLQMQVEIVANS